MAEVLRKSRARGGNVGAWAPGPGRRGSVMLSNTSGTAAERMGGCWCSVSNKKQAEAPSEHRKEGHTQYEEGLLTRQPSMEGGLLPSL